VVLGLSPARRKRRFSCHRLRPMFGLVRTNCVLIRVVHGEHGHRLLLFLASPCTPQYLIDQLAYSKLYQPLVYTVDK
jgi:hypothetical protein